MAARVEQFELWRDRGDRPAVAIRGEVRIPAEARGTVVICHGFKGFAHFAFFPFLAEKIAERGLRAITFDFSGSGVGEDRENFTNPAAFTHNTYLEELDDIEAVVVEARAKGWMEESYGLFGHSRGGGMAILHAARDGNVRALVTWAAISSSNRWLPEVVADWRQQGYINITNARTGQTIPLSIDLLHEVEEHGETRLNIASAAAEIRAPWLIVHGAQDETVDVSEGERLANLAQSGTLRVIEGANHTFGAKHPLTEVAPTLDQVVRETAEFFELNLTGRKM